MRKYKSTVVKYSLVKEPTDIKKVKINNSEDTIDFLREIWDDDIEIQESFYIVLLNQANNVIGYKQLSKGAINGTIADIRLLAKFAIEALAVSVIIAHNHPSGKLEPSRPDNLLTNKVKKGLELLDIKLLDSIIITKEDYISILN